MPGAAIWTNAKRHLADTLSKDVFERWIDVIKFEELDGDRLILSVANDFYHTWLIENYLPLIRNAVVMASTEDLGIEFVVDRERGEIQPVEQDKTIPVSSSPQTNAIPYARRQAFVPVLNHKYTFDSFVVGPSNSFAHAATLAVARSPGRAYNPLFIYGHTGLGKTHLMQAIGHYALADDTTRATVCYISTEAFTNEYIDALQRKELNQFRKKYRSIDILLVDDIHFLGGKERLQEEFFHTFNTLFDSYKQIVMTSDRPASEIPSLEHRLVSRFEWGLVTELEAPDVETRIAILRKKQEQLDLTLSPEIIQYLAENIRSNIRRLEGGMIRVASYISLTGKELSVDQLNYLLKDSLDQEQQEAVTMESIQKVVAEYHDIRFAEMTSKRRPRSIAYPRQIAMYLCRTLTSHSFPEIGNAFDRNHATVLHACRLIRERQKEDTNLRKTLATLQQRLGHR